jgi:hypothetical protein
VVQLVDGHLQMYIWREDDWAGSYPIVDHREIRGRPDPRIDLDGGRFVLEPVTEPELRRHLRTLRLGGSEFARVRDETSAT